MSNLQVLAHRCPVMSKALAVQSARMSGTKRFTSCAAGVAGLGTKQQHLRSSLGGGGGGGGARALHTTPGNGASLETEGYKKSEQGMAFPFNSILE